MSRKLTDLCDLIRIRAEEFLWRAAHDLGFRMRLLDTLRSETEQANAVARGVSKTRRSKHLAQPVCGKSHAFDCVPVHLAVLKNWAPEHPDWLRLGELGESLALEWGGRWSGKWRRPQERDYGIVDCPHFQVSVVHPQITQITQRNNKAKEARNEKDN